jgi:hypothetical protein
MKRSDSSDQRFDLALSEQATKLQIQITAKGLELPESLSVEDWNRFGDFLAQANNSVGFWVGDWINFGERAYGDKYTDAMRVTGFEYGTLMNFAWVANSIKISSRNENLTFKHHQFVAHLPDDQQRQWLSTAEQNGMSTRLLKASISAGRPLADLPERIAAANTHLPHIGKILRWWKEQDPAHISPDERKRIVSELEPVVEIYRRLSEVGG